MKHLFFIMALFVGSFSFAQCEAVMFSVLLNAETAPEGIEIVFTPGFNGSDQSVVPVSLTPNGYGVFTVCLPVECYNVGFSFGNFSAEDIIYVTYVLGGVTTEWTPNLSMGGDIENPLSFCVNSPCATEFNIDLSGCYGVFVTTPANSDNAVSYTVNGDVVSNGENIFTYQFPENGAYEVCMLSCGALTCQEIVVEGCNQQSDCPTQEDFWVGGAGCAMQFEIGSFSPGESVTWNFGDGTIVEGGHYTTHTYADGGVYTVCATYTSNACPEGVELCEVIEVAGCSCATDILVTIDGCIGVFAALPNNNTNVNGIFTVNGQQVSNGESVFTYIFPENGVYEVCVQSCGGTACQVVEVSSCSEENDCPTPNDFYASGEGCQWVFEIGSFVEGENVVWHYGDGVTEEGGHFTDHTYTQSGTYVVCAYYTSSLCLEGVEMCHTIEVTGCGEVECTDITLNISASPDPGVIQNISWVITGNAGVSFGGTFEFLQNTPAQSETFCLPTGCYSLVLTSNLPIQNVQTWMSSGNDFLEWNEPPMIDSFSAFYSFGVNTDDCGSGADCSLEIEYEVNENGNYIFHAIPSMGAAVEWFLDGEYYGTGMNVDGSDFEAGLHEMCAMFETPDCPEGVMQCVSFVVLDLGSCSEVILQIDPQGIPASDLGFELDLSGIIGQLPWAFDGDITLYEESDGTYIGICLPDGCYSFTTTLDQFLEYGILLNLLIEGGLEASYEIDPLNDSVTFEFGINADCGDGVGEWNNTAMLVYPNPSVGMFTLTVPADTYRWEVHATDGRRVAEGNSSRSNSFIYLDGLSNGSYMLSVYTEEHRWVRHIQLLK